MRKVSTDSLLLLMAGDISEQAIFCVRESAPFACASENRNFHPQHRVMSRVSATKTHPKISKYYEVITKWIKSKKPRPDSGRIRVGVTEDHLKSEIRCKKILRNVHIWSRVHLRARIIEGHEHLRLRQTHEQVN